MLEHTKSQTGSLAERAFVVLPALSEVEGSAAKDLHLLVK
jgi:hypothetical protein